MNDGSGIDEHDPALDAAAQRLRVDSAATPTPTVAELGAGHRRRVRRRAARSVVGVTAALVVVVGAAAFVSRDDGPDRSELASTGHTTSTEPAVDPSPRKGVELGPAIDCRPPMPIGFDLSEAMTAGTRRRTQEELLATQQQVTTYADAQPDVVASGYDNADGGSLVVAVFADDSDLGAHLTALRATVDHPDSVVVRGAPSTLAEMMAAQAELHADPAVADGGVLSTGPSWNGLHAQLRADQIGLAERVAAAHPGMAQFVIGAKRYQGDTDGSLRRCAGDPTPTVPALPTGIPIVPVGQAPPGAVGAADVDHEGAVRAGDDVEAVVELRSDRTFTWTPTSIEQVAGVVVRAGTDEVVGAEVVRFSRLMLPAPVTAGPGEPLQITVTAATASADTSDDPALAPGDYEIVASVDIDGQQHLLPRVPFTIE